MRSERPRAAPRGPRCRTELQPPSRERRQRLLRVAIQDAQVPARLPGRFASLATHEPGARSSSTGITTITSIRACSLHTRRCILCPRRRDRCPPPGRTRSRSRRAPRALPQRTARRAQAALLGSINPLPGRRHQPEPDHSAGRGHCTRRTRSSHDVVPRHASVHSAPRSLIILSSRLSHPRWHHLPGSSGWYARSRCWNTSRTTVTALPRGRRCSGRAAGCCCPCRPTSIGSGLG